MTRSGQDLHGSEADPVISSGGGMVALLYGMCGELEPDIFLCLEVALISGDSGS
jgi:hypothetical protein